MSVDQAFSDLLAWTTACGLSPALKEIQVLNRETYGWMEYVPWKSCQTRQEVEHYYQRAGMLLCLLYLLGGTDMHFENLIACADMPMLIDLETVIGTDFSWHLFSDERHAHGQHTPGSTVVGTGLLPGKFADQAILEAIDFSGLGTAKGEMPESFPSWVHVNTNAMILKKEYGRFDEASSASLLNRVMLHDSIIQSQDYQEEIVAGFQKMHHLLLAQRTALLAPDGPLHAFEGCTLRTIVRLSYHYGLVLDTLSSPTSLRDGADRWIEMQFLQGPQRDTATPSKQQTLINAEIAALEHLDLPWFGTHTHSRDLFSDDGVVIKDVFDCSALERVRQRLAQFEETDCERQISLMRAAFLTLPSVESHATEEEPESIAQCPDENRLLTSESLISATSGLAQKLMQFALRGCQSEIFWMGLHYDMKIEGYRLQSVGPDLYDGIGGIALFLAACARLTGDTVSRDFARKAIQPFVEKLLKPSGASVQKELSTVGIGGAAGVGSWVYALTRLSQWLEQPDVLNAATQAALLITPQLVEADHHLDIIAGASGAILGLLALYEVTGDEEVLQRALLCARHLLSERVEIEKGASAWLGHGGIVRTGFSHGAAGIAYALLRLFSVTQQQEFLEAACEAINYERLAFVPEVGNWLDSHSPAASERPQSSMTSWCYGAAGIGLARLGGLTVLDTPAVRQDLEVALSTTLAYGLPSLDNLCCGNFGRIEFLLASAQRLQRPELLMTAQRHASTLVQRATQLGHFHLLANLPRHASNPGLFQGYAGIGYELLRLAAPESIPSVLLWE